MNKGPNWITDTSMGKIGMGQLQGFGPMLREGLEKEGAWGYGIRRITVKSKDDICPITFSAMSYKAREGDWSIGLRMNINKISPIKFEQWRDGDNIVIILTNLMWQHLSEQGYTGNYGELV